MKHNTARKPRMQDDPERAYKPRMYKSEPETPTITEPTEFEVKPSKKKKRK